MPGLHPPEFRQRAVESAQEGITSISQIAADIGISQSCLRHWVAQAEIDGGHREGLTTEERAELVQLRRDNRSERWRKRSWGRPRPFSLPRQNTKRNDFSACGCGEGELPRQGPVQSACVSTSGFYEWRFRRNNPSGKRQADEELTEQIKQIHAGSRRTYGSPRIHAELRLGEGKRVGRKRVARLMRLAGIEGIYRRNRGGCTPRDPSAQSSEDLVKRNFKAEGPNALWVSDISEHPTDEGRLYLAVVLDAYSGRVVGWSIADHIKSELVVDALQMTIWRRQPEAGKTICHSDHGTQLGFKGWSQHRLVEAIANDR